jgi:predicted regulator of Ras-like GTPase activity (Roadblock/LC7/MglB family)
MASEQWVLTGEMSQGIDAALRKFIGDSRARCALLITHSGQLVGQVGFTAHLNVLSLCALVAGIFTTTQELARLIGESKFKSLFQEGKSWNLHFTLVSEDLIFATLFDKKTVIGAVQVSANEASERIGKLLQEIAAKPVLEPDRELEALKRELAHLEQLTGRETAAPPAPPAPMAPMAPSAMMQPGLVQAPAAAPAPPAPPSAVPESKPAPVTQGQAGEKKEGPGEKPQSLLGADFEESAAAALDKLFEI